MRRDAVARHDEAQDQRRVADGQDPGRVSGRRALREEDGDENLHGRLACERLRSSQCRVRVEVRVAKRFKVSDQG